MSCIWRDRGLRFHVFVSSISVIMQFIILVKHFPGRLNVLVDSLPSRHHPVLTAWQLYIPRSSRTFVRCMPYIDIFATSLKSCRPFSLRFQTKSLWLWTHYLWIPSIQPVGQGSTDVSGVLLLPPSDCVHVVEAILISGANCRFWCMFLWFSHQEPISCASLGAVVDAFTSQEHPPSRVKANSGGPA